MDWGAAGVADGAVGTVTAPLVAVGALSGGVTVCGAAVTSIENVISVPSPGVTFTSGVRVAAAPLFASEVGSGEAFKKPVSLGKP